jgi:signal transduction histidine kinase
MRERAERLGGSLRIESASGQGTVVRATMPVPGERASTDSS